MLLWAVLALPCAVEASGDPDSAKSRGGSENNQKMSMDKVLRVAIISLDIPPFVFRTDGHLQGADIDLVRGFAESISVKPVFVPAGNNYARVIEAVSRGQADMAISELSKTMSRARKVLFSRPYMVSGITLLVNRLTEARLQPTQGGKDYKVQEDRHEYLLERLNNSSYTVACMEGSIQDELIQRFFPEVQVLTTRNWVQAGELAVSGEADAAMLPDRIYLLMARQNPEVDYKALPVSLIPDPLNIAVSPDKPELLRLVNDYLDVTAHLRETSIPGLMRKYMDYPQDDRKSLESSAQQDTKSRTGSRSYLVPAVLTAIYSVAIFLFWLLIIRRRDERHWLLSPWAVLLGLVLGTATGSLLATPPFFAGPLAGLFIRFWQLCVLPIMITAVITSIYRLLSDGSNSGLVMRLVLVLAGTMVTVAALGVLLAAWGRPGADFSPEAQQILVKNLDLSRVMEAAPGRDVFQQLMDMARSIVPGNVLEPIVNNQTLSVLFLALFFGVMLTRCRVEARQAVVNVLDAVQGVFTGMVRASLYLLPAALFLLTMDFASRMGVEMLGALMRLTLLMALALVPPLLFGLAALRVRLGFSLGELLHKFMPMALMAFSTRSSVVAMPLGLEAFRSLASGTSSRASGLDQNQIMASFPLLLMACHCGFIIFFCLIPVFIGQVFGVDFTVSQYLFMIFGAVLSALAATGAMAMTHVLLLPIICEPLGLPVEPAVIAGYALLTIMSPFSAAVQTLFSSGLASLIAVNRSDASLAGNIQNKDQTDN